MRSKFCPMFRCFVLAALCACMAFAGGCARENAAAPVKPRSLLVDGKSKPDPPAAVPKNDNPGRPQIKVDLFTPKGNGAQRSVTLKWADKNGAKMTCSAKSADFNEVTQVGSLVDFSAQLYENGKLTASVRAPLATADTAKRIIVASGGVVLKSLERATVVNARWIKWNAGSDTVIGNGGVSIKSTNGSMEGAAFVADTALKTLKVMSSGKGLE
jgi:hypothetical protein